MKFRVLIEPDEDGVFVAEYPVLLGCVSQGRTREEAVANIRDVIQGYIHSLEKLNLAAIGEIALLEGLVGRVLIPSAVEEEIQRLQVSRSRFAGILLPAFVTVLSVQNTPLSTALKLQLDSGEAEAIGRIREMSVKF